MKRFFFFLFFWNNWEKQVSSYMKTIHKSFPFIQLKLIKPCRLQALSGHLFSLAGICLVIQIITGVFLAMLFDFGCVSFAFVIFCLVV
jgi:quinol-cytochrome oxidoreductase complex cytochrome b subunit